MATVTSRHVSWSPAVGVLERLQLLQQRLFRSVVRHEKGLPSGILRQTGVLLMQAVA